MNRRWVRRGSRVLPLVGLLCAATAGHVGLAAPGAAGSARYDGDISAEHNRRFFNELGARRVTRLSITSAGGEVEAGIVLGRWVHERGLDVEVSAYCLSSCANYVFPAGRRKVILPGGVVAWHGNYHHLLMTGTWTDDVDRRMRRTGERRPVARRRVKAQVDRLVDLERDFFASIGVDEGLCWAGKRPPHGVPDYFFMSAEDMTRFGLTGVQVPPYYEHTRLAGVEADLRFVRLGEAASGGP